MALLWSVRKPHGGSWDTGEIRGQTQLGGGTYEVPLCRWKGAGCRVDARIEAVTRDRLPVCVVQKPVSVPFFPFDTGHFPPHTDLQPTQ